VRQASFQNNPIGACIGRGAGNFATDLEATKEAGGPMLADIAARRHTTSIVHLRRKDGGADERFFVAEELCLLAAAARNCSSRRAGKVI